MSSRATRGSGKTLLPSTRLAALRRTRREIASEKSSPGRYAGWLLAAGWLGNFCRGAYSRATPLYRKLIAAKPFEPHWFQTV
jgi:hypothetical protein